MSPRHSGQVVNSPGICYPHRYMRIFRLNPSYRLQSKVPQAEMSAGAVWWPVKVEIPGGCVQC